MNLLAVISISILLSVFLPGGPAHSGTGAAELYVGLPSQPLDDDMQDSEDDDMEEEFDDEDDDEASEEDGNDSYEEWYEPEEGYDNDDQEDYGEDD